MSRPKIILTATLTAGLIMFAVEITAYAVFGGIYADFLGKILDTGFTPVYVIKLLFVNIAIGFFIAAVFDSIYAGLPGGFLRKGINFAFMVWGIQALPFALRLIISTNMDKSLFWLIIFQYLISAVIVSFAMAGIFGEYKASLEKDKNSGPVQSFHGKRKEEKNGGNDKKNSADIPVE